MGSRFFSPAFILHLKLVSTKVLSVLFTCCPSPSSFVLFTYTSSSSTFFPPQIRIRDPNQGGRDITEEIMSGGRSGSTPTPPQVSHRATFLTNSTQESGHTSTLFAFYNFIHLKVTLPDNYCFLGSILKYRKNTFCFI